MGIVWVVFYSFQSQVSVYPRGLPVTILLQLVVSQFCSLVYSWLSILVVSSSWTANTPRSMRICSAIGYRPYGFLNCEPECYIHICICEPRICIPPCCICPTVMYLTSSQSWWSLRRWRWRLVFTVTICPTTARRRFSRRRPNSRPETPKPRGFCCRKGATPKEMKMPYSSSAKSSEMSEENDRLCKWLFVSCLWIV